jgi:hemoglobin
MGPVTFLRRAVACGALVAAAACASSTPEPTNAAKPNSLYIQLGGYDKLAALRDDFLGRMLKDSITAPFFAGLSPRELDRIRQMVVDQLCAVTGGPCVYVGKSMKEAHKNLQITPPVWNEAMRLFNLTLDDFHVTRDQRNALLAIMRSVEPEIVNSP